MARRRRKTTSTYAAKKEIEASFAIVDKALAQFASKDVDKAVRNALAKAEEPVYQDMYKEFSTVHQGKGKTLKDLDKGAPRRTSDGGYKATVQYLRRGTGNKGFVALFFDYGSPHFKDPKAKASEGFIDRAFGYKGNPSREKEIQDIIREELDKAFASLQSKMEGE